MLLGQYQTLTTAPRLRLYTENGAHEASDQQFNERYGNIGKHEDKQASANGEFAVFVNKGHQVQLKRHHIEEMHKWLQTVKELMQKFIIKYRDYDIY